MKPVFADTFYWIALTNPEGSHSQVALRFDDLLSVGHVTTTEEVMTMRREGLTEILTNDKHLSKRASGRYFAIPDPGNE